MFAVKVFLGNVHLKDLPLCRGGAHRTIRRTGHWHKPAKVSSQKISDPFKLRLSLWHVCACPSQNRAMILGNAHFVPDVCLRWLQACQFLLPLIAGDPL